MPVFQLDEQLWFPDPRLGEADGLVAVGGDLSPMRLVLAYSNGFFPWYSFQSGEEPFWYCPLERFVIFPDEIHVSHSMRTLLNKGKYLVSFNRDFRNVIKECATVSNRQSHQGAWLGEDMMEAYIRMHDLGLAKSVEVWQTGPDGNQRLVGGLYGILLRNAFFGESMFSHEPSASKIALIFLARVAAENGWHFIDCQFETPHLKAMGGRLISYDEYMRLLDSDGETA